jgi:hypothetical protein
MRFIRISAPHFCAGADIKDSKVINPAPIIKWMKGKTLWWVRKYCEKKKWEIETYGSNERIC